MNDANSTQTTLVSIIGLLLAFAVLSPLSAPAQTPVATVKDGSGNVVLQSFVEGQLLAPGVMGSGTIPASGSGVRLMWHPAKAALRAGEVNGSEWDDANVGRNSVAFGKNTTASNDEAVAMGQRTTASGDHATAMGSGTTASSVNAVALGRLTEASGSSATAMGLGTTASGNRSTAMGFGTTAATPASLSIGECNDANTSADNTLFVVGNGNFSSGSCTSSDALVLDQGGNLEVTGSFVLPDGTSLDEAEDVGGLSTNTNGASEVSNDDGLIATGTVGTGSIPTSGSGTRMMWYPAKAALRAGEVDGSQWDDANVGTHSVAFGRNTEASGDHSTAMGRATTASGGEATAMGVGTTASGNRSTAMGVGTTASGNRSTAMGRGTAASGSYATAMGRATTASGFAATAMGLGAAASGNRSTAMGEETAASGNLSTAMGLETTASGPAATAMGFGTTAGGEVATAMGLGAAASGDHSTAMGRGTAASGDHSTAMGRGTAASGDHSTAMGRGTTASGDHSTAMGRGTTASGGEATAMGFATTAQARASLVIGRFNVVAGRETSWDANDPLFVAGNGSGEGNRSNALTLEKDGDLSIAGRLTERSDRRLKTGITPLGGDILPKLAELRPVRYEFKNQATHPSGAQIGLVAQDVRKEFPELVSEGANGYLSLAYPKLSAVLVKGLQEQQARLDRQQKQIRDLKAENEKINERLSALEAKVSADDPAVASLAGPWPVAVVLALGFGGLIGALLWRRRS